MKQKIQRILNIIMGSFIGVFIGSGLYRYWHFRKYPDLYIMQSAPWYTGILVQGLFTLVLLAVCLIIKVVLIKNVGAMKKSSIDLGNYFPVSYIYRGWICPCKSWTSECWVCNYTWNLGYNMFRILSKQKVETVS